MTADVSFISLRLLLLPAIRSVAPAAELLLMVKPQFEVGREQVGKGGVVRDDALRAEPRGSRARRCAEASSATPSAARPTAGSRAPRGTARSSCGSD